MKKVRVDIPGLDLVLGGGIPALRRAEDLLESATLLVRGPPGSGKSVFGTQLAGALGRELGCDVAYGCVELLPHELWAQHASFDRAGERIVTPPFPMQEPPKRGECRIFAAILDLGDAGSERENFGAAVLELLDVIEQSGGAPRVLVIDSLSDGYRLGASAPRELADKLCKVAAERGMFLILLEETTDGRPSSWSFATDVVFELEVQAEDQSPDMPAPFDRRITVAKNRFAPSDAGPHRFTIEPARGVVLLPRPSCYLTAWAKDLVLPGPPSPPSPEQAWSLPALEDQPDWRPFRSSMTAVYGSDAALVFGVVRQLGVRSNGTWFPSSNDLFIDFMHRGPSVFDPAQTPEYIVSAGDPFLSGNRLLATATAALGSLREKDGLVRRVIIGDFRALRMFWNPDGIRRAVAVLITILRRAGVPAILFETTAGPSLRGRQALITKLGSLVEFGADTEEPTIVDVADVTIEIATSLTKALAVMTDVRKGLRFDWMLNLPQPGGAPSG